MLWPDRIIKKMTQVKRGNGRQFAAVSRKQQRFSLLKIACSLVLICSFVGVLIQNDPFPGVRKAAMRHRRENELAKADEAQRDFRNPEEVKDEVSTDIKKDSKKIVILLLLLLLLIHHKQKEKMAVGRIHLNLPVSKMGRLGTLLLEQNLNGLHLVLNNSIN